jgi:hypothetical protein
MIDREPSEADFAETDRAIAELNLELARVGVDMSVLAEALRAIYPDAFAKADQDGSTAIGIDAPSALAVIRKIETGAGTHAFLAAMGFTPQSST